MIMIITTNGLQEIVVKGNNNTHMMVLIKRSHVFVCRQLATVPTLGEEAQILLHVSARRLSVQLPMVFGVTQQHLYSERVVWKDDAPLEMEVSPTRIAAGVVVKFVPVLALQDCTATVLKIHVRNYLLAQ
jgi:hypothetical protein